MAERKAKTVAFYDIFNGDADGLCALHQLRLVEPCEAVLVTGVKRDVRLLQRVAPAPGDVLTVLDISLAENRDALAHALEAGARCLYFDHHYAEEIPRHPHLEAHIDPAPDLCTSLLVDRYLHGRHRAWAVVAAFGDNLFDSARRVALPLGLSEEGLEKLRELGEALNYNAYGETVEDLYFHPAELYRRLSRYADPFQFIAREPAFERLRRGYADDIARAQALEPLEETAAGTIYLLPDAAWARRVSGAFANRLARAHPARAHAVLVPSVAGGYTVSVRAPVARPAGAEALCRQFPSGGGRPAAGGINGLPAEMVQAFARKFQEAFSGP
ncbi:acetyltransferase [Pelomicrobium sp. P1]|uniref:acetyltransferase n=1 Tax=Pelomicrobium sp. P1 TaxID=3463361 RepID=UPI003FDC0E51